MSWLKDSYLRQDASHALHREELTDEARAALEAHWAGDLQRAVKLYGTVKFANLPDAIRAVLLADKVLVSVKAGIPFPADAPAEIFESRPAKVVYYYARYSWAFWVDHRIAWSALFKMIAHAPFSGLGAMTWTGLFLVGHMLAIAGWRRTGSWLARMVWDPAHRARLPKAAANIIFAAYPYTLVVTGNLGPAFDLVVRVGEQNLGRDPYYTSLFEVSALYGYAYTGEVARAEIYSKRLTQSQQVGRLSRYMPVAKIMTILPLALRGFGHLIRDEFHREVAKHDLNKSENLINSQFYRASAVVALFLGERTLAESMIAKAIEFRVVTRSFKTWEKFDRRVRELAKRELPFDPHRDQIHFLNPQFSTPANLGVILVKFYLLLGGGDIKDVDALSEDIANELKAQVGWSEAEILTRVPTEVNSDPGLMLGEKYLCFKGMPEARKPFARQMLSALMPAVKATFRLHKERLSVRDLEKDAAVGALANQIAHDIRSPIGALKAVIGDDSMSSDTREILVAAISRIDGIAKELLDRNRKLIDPRENVVFAATTPISEALESVLAEFQIRLGRTSAVTLARCPFEEQTNIAVGVPLHNLQRVFSNVIDNAIDATNGSGNVTVGLTIDNLESVVTVSDDGAGIPEDIIPKLGTKGLTSGKAGGSGLGLHFVLKTVESHGGRVRIDSRQGYGTQVEIRLPILRA